MVLSLQRCASAASIQSIFRPTNKALSVREIEGDISPVTTYVYSSQDDAEFYCAVDEMYRDGISHRLIFATIKLGRIVTVGDFAQLSDRDLAVWNTALEEYDAGMAGPMTSLHRVVRAEF